MNARRTIPRAPLRIRQLAAIHAGAKQLALDDDSYRALLERITGQRSAAHLAARDRARVLDEMHRLGAGAARQMRQAVPAPTHAPNVAAAQQAMLGKIGAILAESGRDWPYAHGIARRMFGRARLEWLRPDELHKLVAALQIDANRRRKRAQAQ
ncbi:MAG: regulatory protein GemA [Proteobacteria bacterium]|nr:regulatory protein GemA [Pseudomonadota bacterium]